MAKFRFGTVERSIAKIGKEMDELIQEMNELEEADREVLLRRLEYDFWEWQTYLQETITKICGEDEETATDWKQILDAAALSISEFHVSAELQQTYKTGATLISRLTTQETVNVITRVLSFAHLLLKHYDEPDFAKKIIKKIVFFSPSDLSRVQELENLRREEGEKHPPQFSPAPRPIMREVVDNGFEQNI